MRRAKPGPMARYMGSHPVCASCAVGCHEECNGTARLPDEYHPLGVASKAAFPSFAPCECIHVPFVTRLAPEASP